MKTNDIKADRIKTDNMKYNNLQNDDTNHQAYLLLRQNEQWYMANKGKHIAIVDGIHIGTGSDEMSFLESILDTYKIPHESNKSQGTTLIYFKKVE